MKSEQRKKHILDAALNAFAENGYERTSISVICSRAGIARPTLYQYFKDKRSLFRELLEGYLAQVHEIIHAKQQAKDKNKAFSEREAMQSVHEELLKEFVGNRDFFTIIFKEAKARNAETEDIVKGMMQAMVKELIDEMRLHPGFEAMGEEDIQFIVLYMIGGMMQIVESYLFDEDKTLSFQEVAKRITNIEARIKGI
jgi:TetR/AcrR family fatty acid metabolism transcriptional regulator